MSKVSRVLTRGVTGVSMLVAAGGITAGCLKRPVVPATPDTTNVYISQIRSTGVDKIDLLFMIDNSISMADKQQILADAVPVLVQRLITPTCVDAMGNAGPQNTDGSCGNGYSPEFKAVKNIHIGIITSSLGDHGSNDVCSQAQNDANVNGGSMPSQYNDLAELLPAVRTGLTSWNNSGFLVWDPRNYKDVPVSDQHNPAPGPNETVPASFITAFTNQVKATGEHGCGYEASLEAWYRFLVDPEPIGGTGGDMTNDGNTSVRPMGVNQLVLQQRQAFMRPDSLLAVVMLSDENDCSIIDENGTQGWLVGFKGGVGKATFHMPRATSGCATNPNDPKVCHPCTDADGGDPACAMGNFLTPNEDSMNMRCFNQVRRFGVDLLYPTQRYVDGLKEPTIRPRLGGMQVPNPLYSSSGGAVPRSQELVFAAGIIGVPWQDVSTNDSWQGRKLTYLRADDLAAKDMNTNLSRWDIILGGDDGKPKDTLMVESIDPRTDPQYPQQHPLVQGVSIQPPTATNQQANPINGHEQNPLTVRDDLQFACIFPLATPVQCTDANADGCDCNKDEATKNSPLCQGLSANADGTQNYAKAYPGVRELQVLRGYGSNAIVASICPKNTTAMGDKAKDADYGYNPAVAAIVDRLKEALTVKCLPRPLTPGRACEAGDTSADCAQPEDVGKVPCAVLEVRPEQDGGSCAGCDPTTGRIDLSGKTGQLVESAAKEYLKNVSYCGGKGQASCDAYCFCRLNQFTDQDVNGQPVDMNNNGTTDLTECKTVGQDPGTLYGYCYVDPDAEIANGGDPNGMLVMGEEALVKDCKSSEKRILRFLGENLPAKDGLAFIACVGAAASD